MKHPGGGCQKEEVLRRRDVHGGKGAELRGILLYLFVQNKGRWEQILIVRFGLGKGPAGERSKGFPTNT